MYGIRGKNVTLLETVMKKRQRTPQAVEERQGTRSGRKRVSSQIQETLKNGTGKNQFFLMKSEVDVFSIDDLAKKTKEPWDGVRNHQAKKIMMSMSAGDLAFFWASNTKEPGIVGMMKVVKEAYPDESQFDPSSPYYDAKATRESPTWYNVDVALEEKFVRPILLKDLKQYADKELKDMPLFLMKRLSVQTVPADAWHFILQTFDTT